MKTNEELRTSLRAWYSKDISLCRRLFLSRHVLIAA